MASEEYHAHEHPVPADHRPTGPNFQAYMTVFYVTPAPDGFTFG